MPLLLHGSYDGAYERRVLLSHSARLSGGNIKSDYPRQKGSEVVRLYRSEEAEQGRDLGEQCLSIAPGCAWRGGLLARTRRGHELASCCRFKKSAHAPGRLRPAPGGDETERKTEVGTLGIASALMAEGGAENHAAWCATGPTTVSKSAPLQ